MFRPLHLAISGQVKGLRFARLPPGAPTKSRKCSRGYGRPLGIEQLDELDILRARQLHHERCAPWYMAGSRRPPPRGGSTPRRRRRGNGSSASARKAWMVCTTTPQLDFGQNLNGLTIDQGAKHGVHQFLYGHGQAETARKIAVVSTYPANALSPALSKLAKVELKTSVLGQLNSPGHLRCGRGFAPTALRGKQIARELGILPATVSRILTARSRRCRARCHRRRTSAPQTARCG